ncbi:furin-like, partial [Saccostrea cucullata]|uniref:furin-like n=1 Tax=Saccostrea cuccullata TaxID=36930 RepID=UPI002ED2D4CB
MTPNTRRVRLVGRGFSLFHVTLSNNWYFTDHFIVSVKGGRYDALRLANKHGFHLLYEVFPNTYVFKRKDGTTNAHIRRGSISLMLRESRNMNTTNAIPDQGVLTSWSQGFTGRGIVIGIVDNGVEINHPDLSENLVSGLSFNFIDGTSNPSPESGHSHGTKCAGIAAAVGNNGHCILGTSYGAKFI